MYCSFLIIIIITMMIIIKIIMPYLSGTYIQYITRKTISFIHSTEPKVFFRPLLLLAAVLCVRGTRGTAAGFALLFFDGGGDDSSCDDDDKEAVRVDPRLLDESLLRLLSGAATTTGGGINSSAVDGVSFSVDGTDTVRAVFNDSNSFRRTFFFW